MDRKLDQPVATCRLPHSVIVRAPGLLPMLYAPSELAEELRISIHTIREWFKHGLPRQRDARGHNWIDGRRFAKWVAELNHARSARSIGQAEAYCVRCRKPVKLIDPVRSCQGKKVLLRGCVPNVAAQSLEVLDMVNRINYKRVKEYLKYLDEVAQLDQASIQRYWFYLKPLLIWAEEHAFNEVSAIRPTFSSRLASARLDGKVGSLAPATLKKVFQTTKRFLVWLKLNYPRDCRDLPDTWIEALRVPRHSQPAANHVFVTLEEVRQIAGLKIDENDLALQRDQAAAVLLFLSGMRAGAFSTLPIKAVDLNQRTLQQLSALGVETKNGKSATTYLLDIPDLLAIVSRWDAFIRARLPSTAMWFTPSIGHWGEQTLSADRPGTHRNAAVAKRLRIVFRLAGLPYKSPHKFRHGHAVYALQHAKTMADYKAVSMNLMHEDIRVTDGIYAPLAGHEVQQRIAGLTNSVVTLPTDTTDLNSLVRALSKEQLSAALIAIAQQLACS